MSNAELDTETTVQAPSELDTLKARATQMGLKFHPSIGVDALREKVLAALNDEAVQQPQEQPVVVASEETPGQKRKRLKAEALKLVRIRVSCMNPAKKDWEGEIFTTGNAAIGSVKKFVPFNAEDGWHVPHCIYEMIRDRHCPIYVSVKDGRGNTVRKHKMIKEFAVEVLPQLTAEELQELAQRQAMAKSID